MKQNYNSDERRKPRGHNKMERPLMLINRKKKHHESGHPRKIDLQIQCSHYRNLTTFFPEIQQKHIISSSKRPRLPKQSEAKIKTSSFGKFHS